jgi:hypothetical protein
MATKRLPEEPHTRDLRVFDLVVEMLGAAAHSFVGRKLTAEEFVATAKAAYDGSPIARGIMNAEFYRIGSELGKKHADEATAQKKKNEAEKTKNGYDLSFLHGKTFPSSGGSS